MKINIGPYINRWTTSYLERSYCEMRYKKNYWEIDDAELNVFDNCVIWVLDKWQTWVLDQTINRYLDNKERNINIKIHDYDTWGMDNTIAHIIHPMLVQLNATKHGSPLVDDIDVPEKLRSTAAKPKENDWDTDEFHHARWEWVMDEMIWTFETIKNPDFEDQFYSGACDWILEETPDGTTMKDNPNNTFKFDREKYDENMNRQKNGLLLFAKYYRSLWD
jgi:hypothetical protein